MTHRRTCYLLSLILAFTVLVGCEQEAEETAESYSDEMAEQHQDDTTTATAAVGEPILPVTAERVAYGAGTAYAPGFMAAPLRPDSVLAARGAEGEALPGLIVIHEWWGLNANVTAMARRLAGEGFRALAVDLYAGEVADTPEEAQDLMELATQDPEFIIDNIEAAHQLLTDEYDAPEVGVIGWCFGGTTSLNAALALPIRLDAAVIYYGQVSEADPDELAALEMPILAFFGAEDESIPVEEVEAFEETMNELDKDIEVHIYEGAGHAFANPTGNNYVPQAAEDAWEETTAFLQEHLYGE